MSRNEAQVRFELIDPALEHRGWNRRTDIRVEETAKPIDIINHQPRKRPAGRTDYVPDRQRLPKNFEDSLCLKFYQIKESSVAVPIFREVEVANQTELFQFEQPDE